MKDYSNGIFFRLLKNKISTFKLLNKWCVGDENRNELPSPKVIFLMVPGPPFPSMISALLMAWGATFGMRLSASRTKALNSLAGGIAEVVSVSYVKTPMMTLRVWNWKVMKWRLKGGLTELGSVWVGKKWELEGGIYNLNDVLIMTRVIIF